MYARRRGVSTSFENVPLDSGFTDSSGFFSFPLSPTDAFTTGYLMIAQAAGFVQKSTLISSIDTVGPSVAGAEFFLVPGNAPILFHAKYVDNTLPPQIERNRKGVFVTTMRSVRVQRYDLRGACLADRTVMPEKTQLLQPGVGGRLCIARIADPDARARTFKMMVMP